jgi:RimJ/RimL family protein N-acetyltransferase
MEVRRCAGAAALLAQAGGFLEAREAEHNLLLGLLGMLRSTPRPYGHEPYLAVVEDGGSIVGTALRTPPFGPVLSELEDVAAADLLAADLRAVYHELPGVLGPRDAAGRFAAAWERLAGARTRIAMEERIYRADTVVHPAAVPGGVREYEPGDRELVLAWLAAFAEEAQSSPSPPFDASEWLERRLAEQDGGIALWEHGGTVSLAGYGNPTPHGIRLGPVYTPPEHRRRGYASALTATVTEELLRRGRRYCFLFTDLANPSSNAIYQRVGYRPVADVDQWHFDAR